MRPKNTARGERVVIRFINRMYLVPVFFWLLNKQCRKRWLLKYVFQTAKMVAWEVLNNKKKKMNVVGSGICLESN